MLRWHPHLSQGSQQSSPRTNQRYCPSQFWGRHCRWAVKSQSPKGQGWIWQFRRWPWTPSYNHDLQAQRSFSSGGTWSWSDPKKEWSQRYPGFGSDEECPWYGTGSKGTEYEEQTREELMRKREKGPAPSTKSVFWAKRTPNWIWVLRNFLIILWTSSSYRLLVECTNLAKDPMDEDLKSFWEDLSSKKENTA